MTKAKDPHKRTGIFKTLEEVPSGYRLKNYEYESRDPWNEYTATVLDDAADTVQYEAGLVEDDWREHMEKRDPHFALARPADVESWCGKLLERMTPKRAYNPYWVRLQDFYDYLVWHTDHPHVYHPPLMAAGTGEAAARVWSKKIEIGETR
jgi:hypothetical protein